MEDGKRKISSLYNFGHRNTAPSAASTAAAQWLVQAVNEGKIKPDWKLIDDSKAAFLAKEMDVVIGYDWRQPDIRQSIFDVHEPCLPNKLLSRYGRKADAFVKGLGIDQLVEDFLATRDLETLGIRPLGTIEALLQRPAVELQAAPAPAV